MTPAQAVDRYEGELTRDNKATTTKARYRRYLYELDEMFPHIDVEDIPPDGWLKWLDRICVGAHGQKLDQDTISQRVSIAKRFTFYLADEGIIPKDPLARVKTPKRKNPIDNDKVVWVTPDETLRMLEVARRDIGLYRDTRDQYRKLLCLGVLAYTGSRRGAVSRLRISDYDGAADPATLTFRQEKGGKFIKKPLSAPLAYLIREADLAGVWVDRHDYLIPSIAHARNPERDARIIYRLVKEVAKDAGVQAHVHALRAAFACFFLESNPDQLTALKDLLGHSQVATTEIYLRRMNRQKGMEVVVDLDWGVPMTAGGGSPSKSAAPAVSVTQLPTGRAAR